MVLGCWQQLEGQYSCSMGEPGPGTGVCSGTYCDDQIIQTEQCTNVAASTEGFMESENYDAECIFQNMHCVNGECVADGDPMIVVRKCKQTAGVNCP